jgi:hypothetical protein
MHNVEMLALVNIIIFISYFIYFMIVNKYKYHELSKK